MGKRGRRRNQGHPARAAERKRRELERQREQVPSDDDHYGQVWKAVAARFPGVDPRTHALMTMAYACDGIAPSDGCGWEHTVWLGLGVEAGKVMVPCPLFCGRCPDCDRPLSHVRWREDVVFDEPKPIPADVARFVLPTSRKAREFQMSGYGGAEYIDPSLKTQPPV